MLLDDKRRQPRKTRREGASMRERERDSVGAKLGFCHVSRSTTLSSLAAWDDGKQTAALQLFGEDRIAVNSGQLFYVYVWSVVFFITLCLICYAIQVETTERSGRVPSAASVNDRAPAVGGFQSVEVLQWTATLKSLMFGILLDVFGILKHVTYAVMRCHDVE